MAPEMLADRLVLRPLVATDLAAVVAIDQAITGRARRTYFERRLAAALRDPGGHIQVAVADREILVGFALAGVLHGEFGQDVTTVALETIGVRPDHRWKGAGDALLGGLEEVMRHKAIRELQTQAAWTDHELLRFLDHHRFSLAPRQVVGCAVAERGSF